MTTRISLFFSPSKIIRALRVKGSIIRAEEWWKVIFVVVFYEGKRKATFVSKKLLFSFFVEDRKERSKYLIVRRQVGKDQYEVLNAEKNSVNVVSLKVGCTCSCKDWKAQKNFLRQPCCKHMYAVLKSLGLGSLSLKNALEVWRKTTLT